MNSEDPTTDSMIATFRKFCFKILLTLPCRVLTKSHADLNKLVHFCLSMYDFLLLYDTKELR